METKLDRVRLKNGSEYPLTGSWNDLNDKPFYTETTETVLMSDAELTFTYSKTTNIYQNVSNDVSDIAEKWVGDWSKAIVAIDGTRYIAKKRVLQDVVVYVGDFYRAEVGMPVTGEPFVVSLNGGSFGIGIFPDAAPEDPDNAPDVTHTISITLVNETVHKLGDVYQHQPDWNNAEKDSASCIKNRPFGLMAEDGAVWAETDLEYSISGGAAIFGADVSPLLYAEKIMLEVEGEKYISTEINRGDGIPDGEVEVSFADADGTIVFSGVAGTEEATGIGDVFGFGQVAETSLTDGQTYHVKVTVFGARKQIDEDYLPILDKESADILDSLVKFTYDSELGNWVLPDIAITAETFERVFNYEYPEIAVDLEKITFTGNQTSGTNSWKRFGNYALFGDTGNEAYSCGIQFTKTTTDGATSYTLTIRLVGDAPADTSTKQTHYINLRFQGIEDTYTIKQEYIPSPPEFDLSAMGLETVVPDGGVKTVTCEVDDLISAIKKGTVKLHMNAVVGVNSDGTPIISPISIVGNALYMENSMYEFFNSVSFNGVDMQIIIWITEADKTIHALIKTVFIPEFDLSAPEFDLSAMGLPDIPMDGTWVRASCDATRLVSALGKGTVKLYAKIKYSDTMTLDYACFANAGQIGDEYNCTMCGVIQNVPMMITITATSSTLSAKIITLAVPSTSTDTTA